MNPEKTTPQTKLPENCTFEEIIIDDPEGSATCTFSIKNISGAHTVRVHLSARGNLVVDSRPINLSPEDKQRLIDFSQEKIEESN